MNDGESEFVIREGIAQCFEGRFDVPVILTRGHHPELEKVLPEYVLRQVDCDGPLLPDWKKPRLEKQGIDEQTVQVVTPNVDDWLKTLRSCNLKNKPNALHDARKVVSHTRTFSRAFCTTAFCVFGAASLWIVVESFVWVFQ